MLVEELGFRPLLQELVGGYLAPIAEVLLPGTVPLSAGGGGGGGEGLRSEGAVTGGAAGGAAAALRFHHAHTVQRVEEKSSATCPLPGSNRGSRHVDAGDVSLNINLHFSDGTSNESAAAIGGGDGGGEEEHPLRGIGGRLLVFGGGGGEQEPAAIVPQLPGYVVLHPSALLHQAELLNRGCRINLVVWCATTVPSTDGGYR
jgi:hypothetical protein